MQESKKNSKTDWIDPDDAPDLSTEAWQKKFATATPRRGRPLSTNKKVSTTIRLSPQVIEYFKSQGKGWQSKIDRVLLEHVNSD